MRELLYLTVGVFAGGFLGIAGMACISSVATGEVRRELAVVRASRNYWEAVAGQWERAYEVECALRNGIAVVGKQVDAAAKEVGL